MTQDSRSECRVSKTDQSGAPGRGRRAGGLDRTDLRILAELRENGRISMAALAERVDVSRASVYSRVEQMTSDGVITGFTVQVDPQRVGLDVCALVFVTVHPQRWSGFRDAVLAMPDVEYCCITTGEHDAMLVVRSPDVGGVHDFATGVVGARPEVRSVVSVVVLDEVVRRSLLLPTDIPDRRHERALLGMTRFTRAADGRGEMARSD
jgi:Lrp/AsnC family leucine-responsive transcriptional regulator